MLISWIVPLYNCERYIGRCIESILCQNLNDSEYEIIIVDDGSTDQSQAVVQSLQNLHNNIILVSQEHLGVGQARNFGLRLSKGEFVHFVDADDLIGPNIIKAIFNKANIQKNEHYDLIGFNHRNFNDINRIPTTSCDSEVSMTRYSVYDFCCEYGFRPNACDYIFRRKFLIKHNIRFGSLTIGEDLIFMLNIYSQTTAHILFAPLTVYYYFQRMDSASNRIDRQYLLQILNNYCEIHKEIYESAALSLYPKEVLAHCSLAYTQCQAITAILAGCFPIKTLKECYAKAHNYALFPIITNSSSPVIKFLSILSNHPHLTHLLSYVYKYFYVPLIRNRRLRI